MKKNILITGANGLLGQHLLMLWNTTHNLYAIVRTLPSNPIANVEYYCSDLSSDWNTDNLPREIDTIVHLAQSTEMRDFPKAGYSIFNVNTNSTAKLLNYGHKIGIDHFIFTSTGGLYQPQETPITENTIIQPSSGPLEHYFNTKHASELLIKSYKQHFKTSIIRPFFIYGPGQRTDMIIPRLIESVKTKKPILLADKVGAHLNPIHASDAALAVDHCLRSDPLPVLNIAGPEVTTIYKIANQIGQILDISPNFEFSSSKANYVVCDTTLLRSLLNRDMISLTQGLQSMIDTPFEA